MKLLIDNLMFKYSMFAELPKYDFFMKVCNYLTLQEMLMLRTINKNWYQDCKKTKFYQIGLDSSGIATWDETEKNTAKNFPSNIVNGWGMIFSIDETGSVRGTNKNNCALGQRKQYTGTLVNGVFKISVYFPYTEQENIYVGSIDDSLLFKGTFTLLKSTGQREAGDTGKMQGNVKIY
jgi:hypothetical protein